MFQNGHLIPKYFTPLEVQHLQQSNLMFPAVPCIVSDWMIKVRVVKVTLRIGSSAMVVKFAELLTVWHCFPQRTDRIPKDIHVEPERFAAELISKLEGVLRQREAEEKLEERLKRVRLVRFKPAPTVFWRTSGSTILLIWFNACE